jgi:hypothetical protein
MIAEWTALAERCEKAMEPDREIDAAIMFDAFAKPVGVMSDGGPRGYLWPDDDPSWNFGMRFPGKDRDWFYQTRAKDEKEMLLLERDGALVLMNNLRIPHLTGSLDAITALIERKLPATWVWTLGQNIHHRTWGVSINNLDSDGAPYSVCWGASSHAPALALCAAFCRAMAEFWPTCSRTETMTWCPRTATESSTNGLNATLWQPDQWIGFGKAD